MPIQLNPDWKKIRNEINRLSDLDVLKAEVQKVRDEISKFDLQDFLSPSAQKKVKEFETRYNKLMKNVGSAQRQLDREFNKLIRQVQKHRETAEGRIHQLKNLAEEQMTRVEKARQDLEARVTGKKAQPAKKSAAKKRQTAKKATSKKVSKKTATKTAKKASKKKVTRKKA